MTFPDFQRQMKRCQSYFTKMSLIAYTRKYEYCTTHGYLMCSRFWVTYNLNNSK